MRQTTRIATPALLLGPAAIHLAVAPMHFLEFVPFGLFFVATALLQAAAAVATIVRPSRRLFAAAACGTAAIVALYVVSRTAGVPVGPRPWQPETIGFPDIACTAMELISLPLLTALAIRGPRRRHPVRAALTAAPAVLVAAALTTVGTATALERMPVAINASPMVPGQPSTTVDLLTAPAGSEPVRSFTLTAEVAGVGGHEAWTYNGTVPGPELRVRQGDRLRVTLVNHLPASTSIHWHGVPGLPNAEDGVAGVTQQAVPPGHSMTYELVASAPGTYWYHSHQETGAQLGLGLYGALVVEPSGGPTEDRDYAVVLHPASDGIEANGAADLRLPARPGERVRLRLIDAVGPGMDGIPETPALLGAPYQVAALDGRDLHQPQVLGPQRVALGMGQRADLVFTMPATGAVRLVDTEPRPATGGLVQGTIAALSGPHHLPMVTIGDGPAPGTAGAARLPLFDPTRYGTPAADPVAEARPDATFPLVLGAGAGFRNGAIELVHTINGHASPDVPPITVHEGQVVRLHIVNDTAEYHPMHLHGHTMSVRSRDGRPLQGSPVHLDSILVGPHETWDVAFAADNPGLWMLHCHVPLHASFGLTMMVDYAGITTPYEMGTRSGNMPE